MRWLIMGRLKTSWSQIQICREFNLTPGVVFNLQFEKQFWDTGSVERKLRQGCPRVTETREYQHLSIIVRHNRDAVTFHLSRELYAVSRTRVSRATVSRRLHKRGLLVRRTVVCLLLCSANRRSRLKEQRSCRLEHGSMGPRSHN
ncbi:HTH_Tnp_Tc3_2 domain-containing protein [Trichonephila clavipes]|nr:HTH_Tnp_Tc3_2 domain-containing protein [Trichonephila clavipes]